MQKEKRWTLGFLCKRCLLKFNDKENSCLCPNTVNARRNHRNSDFRKLYDLKCPTASRMIEEEIQILKRKENEKAKEPIKRCKDCRAKCLTPILTESSLSSCPLLSEVEITFIVAAEKPPKKHQRIVKNEKDLLVELMRLFGLFATNGDGTIKTRNLYIGLEGKEQFVARDRISSVKLFPRKYGFRAKKVAVAKGAVETHFEPI